MALPVRPAQVFRQPLHRSLDLGPCAAPLLASLAASKRAPVLLNGPRFGFGPRRSHLSDLLELRVGVLDQGRTQLVKGIEKTAKVVL